MKFNKETIKRRSALFLFWSWHLIYAILAIFLVLPQLFLPLMSGALTETSPWHYIVYALLIIFLPFISMYFAIRFFNKDYRLLMKYFYGFEMSLLFFLLVRVFTFRDDGVAVHWLLFNVILGLSTWLIFLFIQRNNSDEIPMMNDWRGTVGSTVLGCVGLYFGSVLIIFFLPYFVDFFNEVYWFVIRNFSEALVFFINPLTWLAIIFYILTGAIFLILPISMVYLYVFQFLKRLANLKSAMHWTIVLIVITINLSVFYSSNQQNQQTVFKLLESYETTSKVSLLGQREIIREGLLNAYLARYRYMSTLGMSRSVQHSYRDTFGLTKVAADIPQSVFNSLLKPFLYDGKWDDKDRAATHYAEFFDEPIQKAERERITGTIRHTWEISRDNEAGLLDAANHHVHLDKQSIDIVESDNIAHITVQQELSNLTYLNKETVLHFSLPEDAALTGVWLSDDEDQPLKFPYAIAPKGAAQAIYKAEVNRQVDPALLEQTGPYQYRLRVYPVLGKSSAHQPGEPLFARFSYQTLVDKQGNWPMPKVLEKRNLFWDKDTQYYVNNKVYANKNTLDSFPTNIKQHAYSKSITKLSFQLKDKQLQAIKRQPNKENLPLSKRFAVIIDGSYSMEKHYVDAIESLKSLELNNIQFDSYFCNEKCLPFKHNKNTSPVFFGNSQTLEQLLAFNQIAQENTYDGLIVLSDEGSYELAPESNQPLTLSQPLWLVHLGNSLPYAYDDKVLDTVYTSKGGITKSVLEALRRFQLFDNDLPIRRELTKDTKLISVSDQYLWFAKSNKTSSNTYSKNTTSPTPIAAKHWLRHLIHSQDTKKLTHLDQIHQIAKENSIVSHYSSMLVLVNDRQKEALKKAEQEDDRFDREVESGEQQSTTPNDPFAVPAVPEPEEWALIIIALTFLSYTMWRRKHRFSLSIKRL